MIKDKYHSTLFKTYNDNCTIYTNKIGRRSVTHIKCSIMLVILNLIKNTWCGTAAIKFKTPENFLFFTMCILMCDDSTKQQQQILTLEYFVAY